MNPLAHRRWLIGPTLAAALAASGALPFGRAGASTALAQTPSLDAGMNNPGGAGYTSNPYIPGQQLIPGSRIAPTQSSRPAGWPGGPSADDDTPPRKPKTRQVAPAFGSSPNGTAAAAGAVAQSGAPGQAGVVPLPPIAAAPAGTRPARAAGMPTNLSINPSLGGALAPGAAVGPPAVAQMPAAGVTVRPVGAFAALPPAAPPPGDPALGGAGAPDDSNAPAAVVPTSVEPKLPAVPKMPDKFTGAEIIAWVGPEPILASDVLPDANRHLQKVLDDATRHGHRAPSEEEMENLRKRFMYEYLKRQIDIKLVIVEGRRLIPKEAWPKIVKQFDEQFDKDFLPKMLETEECRSRTELDLKMRKAGSSLESMKRQSMESSFAQYFIEEKVKDDHEITHSEMHTYYQAHHAEYETPAKVRWEHLMARFDKFESKEKAWQAIASWGNMVVAGKPFTDVAQEFSQDPTADDGGVHPWTTKDSLASEVINEAIFTLPVGQMSSIIEDKRGFHIIRVLERHDQEVTPFTDVQAKIAMKIREDRVADKRQEYKAKLRDRTPVWNIFDEENKERESEQLMQAAKKPGGDSTSRQ